MKTLKILFALPIVFTCLVSRAYAYNAALVADIDTGAVLIAENENKLNYPASLTKLMTLYVAFNALEQGRLHLDDYLIVSKIAADAPPVKLGLAAGAKIRVEDAIYALAVHSANDVARVLAENLKGGKENTFATTMMRVAREIGMENTNFENSSGLPDDDHLATARDIALLSMAIYKHFPKYWKYFGVKTWTYNGKTYTNGNRLLETYPGCDGMKTGYTNKSKYSLVATAKRGGRHLIAVVLGAENKDVRAAAATNLLNRGFARLGLSAAPVPQYEPQTVQSIAPQSVRQPAPATSPVVQKYATNAPAINKPVGGICIQFGAYEPFANARTRVQELKNKYNIDANIEEAIVNQKKWHRVRAYGLDNQIAKELMVAEGPINSRECW